jgi:hypothetical protein
MAQSRHFDCRNECPLLSVKRTSQFAGIMSASDPKRTSRPLNRVCFEGKADSVLGSRSPFVHRSFVTPDIFRVRVVVLPDTARLDVVAFAFADRLNGTFCFRGVGVSVVGTKHISSPLERDNAWLLVTAHRAAVESPEPLAAISRDQAFPKVSSPMSGLKRSTWAIRLG